MNQEKLQKHISHLFTHLNQVKRSFIYMAEGKQSQTENYELNVFKSIAKLELQLRGLQKELRIPTDQDNE